jgi:hypothetical protein
MINIHADIVGSLLRPADLVEAQKQLAAGAITAAHFKEIEDRAVDEAIALQESVGLEVITDGAFQSQMTPAVSSFSEHNLDAFLWDDWRDEEGVHRKRRHRPFAKR